MRFIQAMWWKILAIVLIAYTLIAGFLTDVPWLPRLEHTIRNQFFHVTMWFAMMIILTASMIYAIKYLRTNNQTFDIVSSELAVLGTVLGLLGLSTGSVWARYAWGAWWLPDPKLNGALVAMLIYLAYHVLRGVLGKDSQLQGKISSVYNIFAFATLIPLLYILPRTTQSLHPGAQGNPGFNIYDLNSSLRMVFYPAVIGWTLLGLWIATLRIRSKIATLKIIDR